MSKRVPSSTAGALLLLSTLTLLTGAPRAGAQSITDVSLVGANTKLQLEAMRQEREARTPAQKKIHSQLLFAARQARGALAVNGAPRLRSTLPARADGLYEVKIKATVTPELLTLIRTQGGVVTHTYETYHAIYANVPLASLETLAASPDVAFIGLPPDKMLMNGGASPARTAAENFAPNVAAWRPAAPSYLPLEIDTPINDPEGDATHGAKATRAKYAISGAGIKVGVLSDSIDNGEGYYQNALESGYVSDVFVPVEQEGNGAGEGLAQLEIVHRLAPGAQLFFATASNTEEQFAENIGQLQQEGCRVILDDVAYADEGMFQDSTVAKAVVAATAKGALYFSAAGNFSNKDHKTSCTWEGNFKSTSDDGFLDFLGGTSKTPQEKNVLSSEYDSVTVTLFWDEPMTDASSQYNLYEFDSDGNIVQEADDDVANTHTPFQGLNYVNAGDSLGIQLTSGSARFLHLQAFAYYTTLAVSTSGAIFGHCGCDATNSFSVEATPAADALASGDPSGPYPAQFTGKDQIELFCSDGPRRMFYHSDGSAITPGNLTASGGKLYAKPDFIAADGVTTSLPEDGGLNPFYGTSAAVPHAGALAALLLSYKPALTSTLAATILHKGCVQIATPGSGNRDAGSGILLAPNVIAAVAEVVPIISSAKTGTGTEGKAYSYQITASYGPTGFAVTGLPAGLTVNAKTGLVSGTPTKAGTYSLTLKATNAAGTGQATLKLTVKAS